MRTLTCFPLEEVAHLVLGAAILTDDDSVYRELTSELRTAGADDPVLTWLHTLNRGWLELAANLLLMRLALTILDPDRSRTLH